MTYLMMKRELLTLDESIRLSTGIWIVIKIRNDFKENEIVDIMTLNYKKLERTIYNMLRKLSVKCYFCYNISERT